MLVRKLYLGGIINQKTYLNHELGTKFFFFWDRKITLMVAAMVSSHGSQLLVSRGMDFESSLETGKFKGVVHMWVKMLRKIAAYLLSFFLHLCD